MLVLEHPLLVDRLTREVPLLEAVPATRGTGSRYRRLAPWRSQLRRDFPSEDSPETAANSALLLSSLSVQRYVPSYYGAQQRIPTLNLGIYVKKKRTLSL